MVISLVYTPPILTLERERGNTNGRIVRHCLVRLAMKLVVARFCRAKDHESMKAQSVCGQKTAYLSPHTGTMSSVDNS